MHTPTVMVTGSREMVCSTPVLHALEAAAKLLGADRLLVVHGGARGADAVAAAVAQGLGHLAREVPAHWEEHTKACPASHAGQRTCRMAGHRRNAEMLDLAPDLVLGFPAHLRTDRSGSRGTWGTIDNAVSRKLPTLVAWGAELWPAEGLAKEMVAARMRHLGQVPGTRGQALAALLAADQ